MTEGRNRLVRRMFDAVGYPALRVIRTEMATLPLGSLKAGQYRYLTQGELAAIYRTAGLPPRYAAGGRAAELTVFGKARRGRGIRPGLDGYESVQKAKASAPKPTTTGKSRHSKAAPSSKPKVTPRGRPEVTPGASQPSTRPRRKGSRLLVKKSR